MDSTFAGEQTHDAIFDTNMGQMLAMDNPNEIVGFNKLMDQSLSLQRQRENFQNPAFNEMDAAIRSNNSGASGSPLELSSSQQMPSDSEI